MYHVDWNSGVIHGWQGSGISCVLCVLNGLHEWITHPCSQNSQRMGHFIGIHTEIDQVSEKVLWSA